LIFTVRRNASAVYAISIVVHVSVCPFVCLFYSMAKYKITQAMPHHSTGTLFLRHQRSGKFQTGDDKCKLGRLKSATSDK